MKVFVVTVANKRFCSPACQCRSARLRRRARDDAPTARRYAPFAATLRVDEAKLLELRERAAHELAHGVVVGAPGEHMARIANLILAADRRLRA